MIVRSRSLTVDDPAFRAYVECLVGDVVALGPTLVAGTQSYYQSQDPSLVSADWRAAVREHARGAERHR